MRRQPKYFRFAAAASIIEMRWDLNKPVNFLSGIPIPDQ